MNITLSQMEYAIAVWKWQGFQKAAKACHVTQPTLSMQIQKLESNLEMVLFDRKKNPIEPTFNAIPILKGFQNIIAESHAICEHASEQRSEISGTIKVGIIPTLGPYLSPLFIENFLNEHKSAKLEIFEQTTHSIISGLNNGEIDLGILATPLVEAGITEHILFYEPFYLFAHKSSPFFSMKSVSPKDLSSEGLLILDDGHCMRSQMLHLCRLREKAKNSSNRLTFTGGSIETLINLVKQGNGHTIVPDLASQKIESKSCQKIPFAGKTPVREISLVHKTNYPRESVTKALIESIKNTIPDTVRTQSTGFSKVKLDI